MTVQEIMNQAQCLSKTYDQTEQSDNELLENKSLLLAVIPEVEDQESMDNKTQPLELNQPFNDAATRQFTHQIYNSHTFDGFYLDF